MAIMGSGAVGVEFASIFRRFGSEVTIIELLPRLVPVEDEAVSAELEQSFKKQGIKVMTGTKVTARQGRAPTASSIEAQTADGKTADAQGRLPAGRDRPRPGHRAGSAPKSVGLRMERGYIKVDQRLPRPASPASRRSATSSPSTQPGHPQLAHLSSAEGIVAGRADRRPASSAPINYDQVPGCTYCDPEIGSVGLTEKEAQAARLRRQDRHLQVRRPRPRPDRRRDRRLRQDRRSRRNTTRSSACT